MKFGDPQWLWALVAIPIFYSFAFFLLSRKKKTLKLYSKKKLWPIMIPDVSFSARRRKIWTIGFVFVFSILALARPQWGYREKKVTTTGLDVMIALDLSKSMEVEDVVPSRLKKAKHFIRSFMKRAGGDRIGMIAFAGSAYPASPLTTDQGYILEVLDSLTTKTIYNQGTDIGMALETAAQAISRGAEEVDLQNDGRPSRVILLISDGEDLEGLIDEGLNSVQKAQARLYVFGVGTERGGKIPARDRNGILRGYKKDEMGREITSKFNPKALIKLASDSGGRYWTMSDSESEIDDLLGEMGGLERRDLGEKTYRIYEERYQWPLVIAIVLALLELFLPARRTVAALFLLSALNSGEGLAKEPGVDVYIKNRDGLKAYEEGRIDDAREKFGEAQAQDPSRPELLFNQGVIEGEQENGASAVLSFETAAQEAKKRKNEHLAARSLYNSGVSSERQGQLENAAEAYFRALKSAKKLNDPDFEKKIRDSFQRLAVKRQQQKQQGEGEGDGQSQSGEENQQKGKEGDQSGKQDQENQGQKPKKFKKQSSIGRKFQSKKLKQEDAEQVMRDLKNREKETRLRLQRRRGQKTRGGPKGKDW